MLTKIVIFFVHCSPNSRPIHSVHFYNNLDSDTFSQILMSETVCTTISGKNSVKLTISQRAKDLYCKSFCQNIFKVRDNFRNHYSLWRVNFRNLSLQMYHVLLRGGQVKLKCTYLVNYVIPK